MTTWTQVAAPTTTYSGGSAQGLFPGALWLDDLNWDDLLLWAGRTDYTLIVAGDNSEADEDNI